MNRRKRLCGLLALATLTFAAGGTASAALVCDNVAVKSVSIRADSDLVLATLKQGELTGWGTETFRICSLAGSAGNVDADECRALKVLLLTALVANQEIKILSGDTGPATCAEWKDFDAGWPKLHNHLQELILTDSVESVVETVVDGDAGASDEGPAESQKLELSSM